MGYEYDSMDEADQGNNNDAGNSYQSHMIKFSIEQLKLRVQGQKKSRENPEQIAINKKKYEEQ